MLNGVQTVKKTTLKRQEFRRGVQRYQCNDCKKKVQSKRRPNKLLEVIFKKYISRRQTLNNLAKDYDRSIAKIFDYEPPELTFKTYIVIDILLVKSINPTTKKASYLHPKIVSAYRSIRRNLPYLSTYEKVNECSC